MGLADALERLTDAELAQLLAHRPDLLSPPPASFSDLASRASTPYSIDACLGTLDVFTRQVAECLVYLDRAATPVDIASLPAEPGDASAVATALDSLRRLGLALPDGEGTAPPAPDRLPRRYRPTPGMVRQWNQPLRTGPPLARCLTQMTAADLALAVRALGFSLRPNTPKPAIVEALCADLLRPGRIGELIGAAGPEAEAVLRRLEASGTTARVLTGQWDRPRLPVHLQKLLNFGLLAPLDWQTVELPREVAIVLRGGAPFAALPPSEAPAVVAEGAPRRWDPAPDYEELSPVACVQAVERMLRAWGENPPAALKNGGMGVREVKAAARLAGLSERATARLVQQMGDAGWVATEWRASAITPRRPDGSDGEARTPAARWVALVRAWMLSNHDGGTAGGRDENGKPIAPLMPHYLDPDAVLRRAQFVGAALLTPPGAVLDRLTLARHVQWRAPRRWGNPLERVLARVGNLLGEMGVLGLLQAGTIRPEAREVLAAALGAPAAALAAATSVFPALVSEFLVGPDLTVLAAAELDPDVAAILEAMTVPESRGAASLLRFTDASIGAALDKGFASEEILAFLARHSGGSGVPQPLRYLVADVARRYGVMRVGAAAAFVRCADEALLAEVVLARKTVKARLALVAPTVAVSPLPAEVVLDVLRQAGYLPAFAGEEGGNDGNEGGAIEVLETARPKGLGLAAPQTLRRGALDDALAKVDALQERATRAALDRARHAWHSMLGPIDAPPPDSLDRAVRALRASRRI